MNESFYLLNLICKNNTFPKIIVQLMKFFHTIKNSFIIL
jgi:hypothetical protein